MKQRYIAVLSDMIVSLIDDVDIVGPFIGHTIGINP